MILFVVFAASLLILSFRYSLTHTHARAHHFTTADSTKNVPPAIYSYSKKSLRKKEFSSYSRSRGKWSVFFVQAIRNGRESGRFLKKERLQILQLM
jgi:hypothetical protein